MIAMLISHFPNSTFEKNKKNCKLLGTNSVLKKKESDNSFSIITLYCVGVIILYSVYFD